MVIYKNTVKGFRDDVDNDRIDSLLKDTFSRIPGLNITIAEERSWKASPKYLEVVLRQGNIPDDCGVLLEYLVPGRKCRVDFILTGKDQQGNSNFIVMELKQWDRADAFPQEGMVSVRVGNGIHQEHPSYQAMAYEKIIETVNENVSLYNLRGRACVYLHNMKKADAGGILDDHYKHYYEEVPVFFRQEIHELSSYLRRYVENGEGMEIAEKLGAAKGVMPYKLSENVDSIFQGEDRYYILDDQRLVYESIIKELRQNRRGKKVIVVKGGAGTGKSILALKVLRQALDRNLFVRFIGPNVAFRKVIEKTLKSKIKDNGKKSMLGKCFSGSYSIWKYRKNSFDCLIVDEAHRLKNSMANHYKGNNQIRDIINASRVSVFFVDKYQQIRLEDIGDPDSIIEIAEDIGVRTEEYELRAQFRCAGADGFTNWILNVLQIEETANIEGWESNGFDCRLFEDPNDMYEVIKSKNKGTNVARIVAGFAWEWSNCKEAEIDDVIIDEHQFRMPWNRRRQREYYAINPDSVNEVGCVHTVQGLEFDYVGVIIGNDLRYDPEKKEIIADIKEYKDRAGKRGLKENTEEQTRLIKNIYRILLTRGMKGCYIYCRDKNLQKYINENLQFQKNEGNR